MLANIEFDLKQEAEALGGTKQGEVRTSFGVDEEEFKEISRQMRAVAEEQARERKREKEAMKEKKNG